MLIYGSNEPFGAVAASMSEAAYKSNLGKRKRASSQTKALKRGSGLKSFNKTPKKVKKRKTGSRNKNLKVKNLKFLKKLGFKVNKR